MATKFWNVLSGVVDNNPLAIGGTTLNSTGLANMPAITAPDTMWLVLDPNGTAGTPEIVQVTAHTAAATSCTIVRGQQTGTGGGAARQHNQNTVWVAAATEADFAELPFKKLTTTGDILYASAANTASRLAIGSAGQALTPAGGVPTWGQVTAAGIASDAVTTAKILDANVTTAKIADSNVTTAKIADANVTRVKLTTDVLPSKGFVATGEATSSSSYVDLATVGPSVTLTTGSVVRVHLYWVQSGAPLISGSPMSVAVSGATTATADTVPVQSGQSDSGTIKCATILINVNSGSNTFTAKYKSNGSSLTFSQRLIFVERLD